MNIQKLHHYRKHGYTSGPTDTVVFEEEMIELQLEDFDTSTEDEWSMIPLNKLVVRTEDETS